MSGVTGSNQDVDIDLAGLFRAVWQRKTIVLGATIGVAALAMIGSSLISPRYEGETRLLIEARGASFSTQSNTSQSNSEPVFDELSIASQVQLLRSVDLIKQVARDFKLYELQEFDPDTNPSIVSDLMVLLRLKKNPLDLAPEERVLKSFTEKLQVYQVEKSRVIGIQFESKDPKLAADIPNKMAEIYMALQSGAKLDSNSEAARWLEPEIANLREKVREAEQKVASYRNSAGLFASSETTNLTTQQLNDISLELARIRGEKADAEAKANNVRAALKAGKLTENLDAVRSSTVVQNLKESEADIRRQLAQLSTAMLDGHPQIRALRAQLDGVRSQIDNEATRIAAGLEDAAEIARMREKQLMQQINTMKADTAQANEDEVGLKALEREATAQRQLLETYLARYREATTRLEKIASPADARVISTAFEPQEPSFPKVLPITIVAALATLILSSIIIMLVELFSGRAFRPVARTEAEPLPALVTQPVATSTPVPAAAKVEETEDEDAYHEPVRATPPRRMQSRQPSRTSDRAPKNGDNSNATLVRKGAPPSLLVAEATETHDDDDYQEPVAQIDTDDEDEFSIATVAAFLIAQKVNIAIAISPSGDDGSTATVMLARRLAETGRKVVLIDMTGSACPTRLMSRHRDVPGITDLLCGEAAFADSIHLDRLSDAHVIPQGVSDIREAMSGVDRLSSIADALAEVYDLVLIECGPANADGVARMSRTGAHEIILSAPEPDRDELEGIMESFERVGYTDLILMSDGDQAGHDPRHRRAA